MKKVFSFFVLFTALILCVGCGNGSKTDDQTNTNGRDLTDSGPDNGADPAEEPDSDTTDTTPDGGDSQSDNADAVSDDDTDSGEMPVPPDPEDCLYLRCAPPVTCKLDESIINSDAEHYFGFKGVGKINASDTQNPEWANLVKVALAGIDGKDLDYAGSYSFFLETSLNAYGGFDVPAVALEALGDPNMSSGRFTTIALAIVPVQFIDVLKAYKEFEGVFPVAPIVQIFDLAYTSDNAYVKQCVVAENKYGMNEVFGAETAVGKTQVCADEYKNETFKADEPFKLAINAELAVGQELVDMHSDAEKIEDLCTCYDMNAADENDIVDCSEISWE